MRVDAVLGYSNRMTTTFSPATCTTMEMDNVTDYVNVTLPTSSGPQFVNTQHLVAMTIVLGLMILCTIIGNVFVIAAIVLEKNLHNVANYLILSLAVADLMVASLVMPISAISEMTQKIWFLPSEVCDMWTFFDVLCCTSSIFHLVAISIDRYWAVTHIDYIRNRTAKRILIMIAMVWLIALCISVPPFIGWKDDNDPAETGICMISQDHGYTIFSTVGAFYLPTLAMLIIYAKIFFVARARIRRKRFIKKATTRQKKVTEMTMLTLPHTSVAENSEAPCNGSSGEHDDNENNCKSNGHVDESEIVMLPKSSNDVLKAKKQKEKLEMRRERKAARTGTFIVCWLPFFIVAISAPFLRDGNVLNPTIVDSITLWLGYLNSLLNPVIYTIFNPEFRNAFQKILFGKYKRKRRKM